VTPSGVTLPASAVGWKTPLSGGVAAVHAVSSMRASAQVWELDVSTKAPPTHTGAGLQLAQSWNACALLPAQAASIVMHEARHETPPQSASPAAAQTVSQVAPPAALALPLALEQAAAPIARARTAIMLLGRRLGMRMVGVLVAPRVSPAFGSRPR
jgi:hypothetical protein